MRHHHSSRRLDRAGGAACFLRRPRATPARLIALIALPALVGCSIVQVDVYTPDPKQPPPEPANYDDREFATVLRENVKGNLVDYGHLKAHPEPLNRYLGMLAVSGPSAQPETFKTRSSRLALYLNAYNAGVLQTVLFRGVPETMHDVRIAPLDAGHRIVIDGAKISLAEIREKVREYSGGDARVEFGMCDAALGSPPLMDQPFRPDLLRRQLRQLASNAINNRDQVQIDHENRRLLVSTVIFQNREAFLEDHRRQTGTRADSLLSVLLQLADGQRRAWLNTAVGYEIGVIPFERALNAWDSSAQSAG